MRSPIKTQLVVNWSMSTVYRMTTNVYSILTKKANVYWMTCIHYGHRTCQHHRRSNKTLSRPRMAVPVVINKMGTWQPQWNLGVHGLHHRELLYVIRWRERWRIWTPPIDSKTIIMMCYCWIFVHLQLCNVWHHIYPIHNLNHLYEILLFFALH